MKKILLIAIILLISCIPPPPLTKEGRDCITKINYRLQCETFCEIEDGKFIKVLKIHRYYDKKWHTTIIRKELCTGCNEYTKQDYDCHLNISR